MATTAVRAFSPHYRKICSDARCALESQLAQAVPSPASEPPQLTRDCFFLGPGRCYAFWQEVLGCYVVNSGEGENGKKKCVPALEDYHECLHHRKEVIPIPA
jgi:hypothetical protein